MSNLERKFGKRLRQLRQAHGLTQEQLASKVNVSYQAISNIERGVTAPSFNTVAEVAKALKLKPKDLFDF